MAKAPAPNKSGDKQAQPSGEGPADAPRSGRKGPWRVAGPASGLARTIAGRNGFSLLTVATRWREIAGEALANHTQPLAVSKNASGGTLQLRAESGAALLVQHQTREIMARVNAILGDGAITQIKLTQGAIPRTRTDPKPLPPRLTAAEEAAIAAQLDTVQDETLRAKLAGLMRASIAGQKTR